MFHRALQRVWLTNRGRLLLCTPCPVQNCISPFSLELVMFSDFRTSLGTYILLCSILLYSSIHSTALLIQLLQSPCTSLSRHVYNWISLHVTLNNHSTQLNIYSVWLFYFVPFLKWPSAPEGALSLPQIFEENLKLKLRMDLTTLGTYRNKDALPMESVFSCFWWSWN